MLRAIGFAIALSVTIQPTWGQAAKKSPGEYLTTQVAMCVQCHTPRNHEDELIEDELFLGAPIPLEQIPEGWALRAPRIARLPGGWTEADLIRLLQTGKRPDGSSPNPPMPPFRMNREDASAVAAFLKSLDTTMGR